jgi:N-acetyl-gamma-glutamyl-phosphate reductase
MKKVKVGIVGGAGYTGGELIRLLLQHPQAELAFVLSKSNAENYLYEVHPDLFGQINMKFTSELKKNIDVLFLCLAFGESVKFLQEHPLTQHIKVIDLSRDFRPGSSDSKDFIYGLPEMNREKIKKTNKISNPGCFATAIQLALLPLMLNKQIQNEVHVSGITGSTGAGQKLTPTSHFSWRNNNVAVYHAFNHQHLKEINYHIKMFLPKGKTKLNFLPFRGSFSRGILVACYMLCDLSIDQVNKMYEEYYNTHPFVRITPKNPDVKQVVNTNNCFLYLEKNQDTLLIISVIDNLLKGASGQAVQNMNLLFGLDEEMGLKLKPSGF